MVDIDKYLARYNLLHEPKYTRFKDAFVEFYRIQKIDIRLQLKKYTVPEFSLVELKQMVNIILL